ncbi:MAG: PAS domain-containing protein, partial [Nitrospirae bacterium]|nr:PAS domain-containing protein [Nitrospirota bacterium]
MTRRNLIKQIALIVLLPSIILPLVNVFFIQPAFMSILVEENKDEAIRLATYLKSSLDLEQNELVSGALPKKFLEEIENIRKELNLYKLNIFSSSGEVIYSTEPVETGYVTQEDFFVKGVAAGRPHAVYVQKGHKSLEDMSISADVVEAYVPIMKGDRFMGAFEIYYDITYAKNEIDGIGNIVSLVLFIVTILLLSTMAIIFARTQKITSMQKKTEDALITEKLKSETIIAALGEGLSIQDTSYRVLYQNQVHRDLAGGDKTGQYCHLAYQQKDQVCDGCHLAMAFADGRIHKSEQCRTTDKGTIYYEIIASPLRDSKGEIIAGIEVVRDITDRKRLEEQLRHAQKMEALGTLTGGISHEF